MLLPAMLFFMIAYRMLKLFHYAYFKKLYKNILYDFKEMNIYLAIFVTLFPFVPTGSFFNNWLNIIYFLPVGFVIMKEKKLNL